MGEGSGVRKWSKIFSLLFSFIPTFPFFPPFHFPSFLLVLRLPFLQSNCLSSPEKGDEKGEDDNTVRGIKGSRKHISFLSTWSGH